MGSGGRVWKADSNVPVFLFLSFFSSSQLSILLSCLGQVSGTNTSHQSVWSQAAWKHSGEHKEALCSANTSMYTPEITFGLREHRYQQPPFSAAWIFESRFMRRDEQTARCMWTDDLHQPKLFRGEKWKWEYWRKWLAELNWVLSLKIRLVTSSQSPKWRLQKSCFVWSTV